jgi:uncharacterized protein (UPF0248 family)
VIPIRELLNRIRWDRDFGRGHFEIGYYDHVEKKILRIPFQEIRFQDSNPFSFALRSGQGEDLTIPFHRVRVVYKDGIPIWSRKSPSKKPEASKKRGG